jgi:hypothetical protein
VLASRPIQEILDRYESRHEDACPKFG